MAFDYFYGAQSQQFAFYRIPKVLFTDNRFQNISTEGKVLYGLLLDRVSLSICIAGDVKSVNVVKGRFMKLNMEHIRYVMNCMQENTTKIRSIKQYMLAALYNAPATIDSYYRAEVNHDMAEGKI